MSKLLLNEQVEGVINSYPGDNLDIIDRLFKGKIRLEVLPQVIELPSESHASFPGRALCLNGAK